MGSCVRPTPHQRIVDLLLAQIAESCRRHMRNGILCGVENSHVSTQGYLVISEAALSVHCPIGTHAIDNEAVISDRRLKSLQSIPLNRMNGCRTSVLPVTHRSCYK